MVPSFCRGQIGFGGGVFILHKGDANLIVASFRFLEKGDVLYYDAMVVLVGLQAGMTEGVQ